MDSERFDRLVAEAARRPSRRAAMRLLAGGLLGGLLATRGATARAQRADGDDDGLYDDDETYVYGTDPFNPDTDGDGFGDGEEIYYGTNPLVADIDVVNGNGDLGGAPDPGPGGTIGAVACLPGEILCNGVCVQPFYDRNNCGFCGVVCAATGYCIEGLCSGIAAPPVFEAPR